MILVQNLWKRFGDLWALRGLSFEVASGCVFGLIGPNGAGKTTALRILGTSLAPSFGDALIDGRSSVRDAELVRPSLGYMPERFSLYDDLYVEEYLEFFAGAYHVRRGDRDKKVDEVLELTDLEMKRREYLSSLSKGMRQRVLLAKCLIHNPKVLLLDEPASGLDPRARIELRGILRALAEMGKSVVISSHILAELGEMCDSVGIMEHGRMIFSGPVSEIGSRLTSARNIKLRYIGEMETVRRELQSFKYLEGIEVREGEATFQMQGEDRDKAEILAALVRNDVAVFEYHEEPTGLEDLFLEVSRGGPT